MISEADLQVAVDAILDGNISAQVWDGVPEGTPTPYVDIGVSNSIPEDAHDQDGQDIEFTLHVWDDQNGSDRVKRVAAEIDALLNHRWVTFAGGRAWISRSLFEVIQEREPDGKTWRHGVLRYRARSHEV